MGEFFEGKITIDENLYLFKEDGELYNHLKLDMYAPLSDCVHADDLPRLNEILNSVKNDGSNNTSAIRMLCQDNTYRWFMIIAEKEHFEVNGQNMMTLLLSDWLLQSDYMNLLLEKVSYNDAYLQMLQGILLCYDRNADYLDIFMQQDNHHISFFSGNIAKWKQFCLENRVSKQDIPALFEFSDDLEAGRSGTYDILTNMFSEQGKESLFTFKCNMVHGQTQIVLGCIIPHAQGSAALLGETYEKDVGIDALNKKAITEYAKRAIHAAGDQKVYIGIIDLDNFKIINDTYGHLFGDEVLKLSGEIIKNALGNRGMLGRIGGDEMMIVVDQISDYTELRNLLRTIRTNIEWAYKGKGDNIVTTCSIGISCYPDQGSTFEEVFEVSDRMLYLAKGKGKNRYVIYTPGLHDNQKEMDCLHAKPQDIDAEQFKNNKIGVLQRMIDDYLIRKVVTNEVMFREIGLAFELQEILYVSEENAFVLQWTPEGTSYDISAVHAFYLDDDFVKCFDQNGMFFMNNYTIIEGKCPAVAKELKQRNVQSAIFYHLTNASGYLMFARKNSRSLWSEYEMMAFGIIARTIDIAIMNR